MLCQVKNKRRHECIFNNGRISPMDDKNKSTVIDFITAKEAILKELSSLEAVASGDIALP
jgi:hypothetical protein